MGRKISTLMRPITAAMLAVCRGCSVDFFARRLVSHNTSKGMFSLWRLGRAEKLLAKGKISSHHRIPTADGTTLDVWVIQGRDASNAPPRGTVLLSHGILDSKGRFFSMAQHLADKGYTVAMLDHRSHGRSEGKYITFGAKEKFDLRDVVDALLEQDRIGEPIYVFGQSMGAAIAIQYAAVDPRCRAVMAVSPFTDLRSVAKRFVPLMKTAKFDQVLARASEIADFDPEQTSTLAAARALKVPLLVVHGRIDAIVPHSHGVEVYNAADVPKTLITFPLLGHVSLLVGRQTWFAEQADMHFRQNLAAGKR